MRQAALVLTGNPCSQRWLRLSSKAGASSAADWLRTGLSVCLAQEADPSASHPEDGFSSIAGVSTPSGIEERLTTRGWWSLPLDGCLFGLVDEVTQRLGEPVDSITHR